MDGGSAQDPSEAAEDALLPVSAIFAESEDHYREYWATADIVIGGQPEMQQAIRWGLFQLAQATARAGVAGIPAKGVSGSGYEGHYFWDQEVYLLPYLTYTNPDNARKVLESGTRCCRTPRSAPRNSAWTAPCSRGAPSTASKPAPITPPAPPSSTSRPPSRSRPTGTCGPAATRTSSAAWAAELLIETARMWASLGFFGKDGLFHIHGVTGPDEYTAVVNDNLYTNVMARFNLRAAAALDHQGIDDAERELWEQAANRMQLPYDEDLQVHSQDNDFMTLEPWDWNTPRSKYPLLLNFHPLVIYRHQVLKQADSVLAMFLQWQDFTAEEKQRAFDFYDPITTGDSTLSACVQGIMAAEVGYGKAALDHFTHALFIDLDDTHGNTIDGVHIASTGGVWSSLVSGFAGLRDQG